MASLVGSEADLSDFLSALLRLEYDAIEAYSVAIDRFDDITLKIRFQRFRADHQRHTRDLAGVLSRRGTPAPEGPGARALLAEGKVVVGNWLGDRGILRAMLSNEEETNAAYDRGLARIDLGPELEFLLARHRDDERQHRSFIVEQLALTGNAPDEPASEEFLGARWG